MTIYDELKFREIIAQSTNDKKTEDLINNKKAIFYLGCDPTADSLHVGHFVQMMLMSRLQKCGHSPICLFGGGTGFVGDPSGKNSMRRMMPKEEINHNVKCFQKQMSKFLDISNVTFVNNADWLCNLNYIDFLRNIGCYFNVNRMLAAECYKQRLEDGLTFFELNYMIMQSYDFLYLHNKFNCVMQIGGNDQWSNMISGVDLVRKKTQHEVYALTTNLLTTSDGKKMGKTEKGALWLDPNKTSPYEFYQYWRNIQDSDVVKCIKMLTNIDLNTIKDIESLSGKQLNDAKELLSYELTKLVHGKNEAEKSRKMSTQIFNSNEMSNAPEISIDSNQLSDEIALIDLLLISKMVSSKGEARRLIEQNGISVDGSLANIDCKVKKKSLESGVIIKKGKKTYNKIICK